ncbi:MAG: TlpA family protein disulfide reductase [Bryobacterales bacterium]|nr:TlpA family protein disulfide reductase [Bryobacterales bacterium]
MLEASIAKDPAFGAPRLILAQIYGGGKFEDTTKAAGMVSAYFSACPASLDSTSQSLLGRFGAPDLQKRVAQELRARLAQESDGQNLQHYSDLWSLEFRLRPPAEHAQVRAQVLKDVRSIEAKDAAPGVDVLSALRDGYKLAGAPVELMAAVEDRIFQKYPANFTALSIRLERRKREHPLPKPEAGAEEWGRYQRASADAAAMWVKTAPREEYAWIMYLVRLRDMASASGEEVRLAAEGYLRASEELTGPRFEARQRAASLYLTHKVDPQRASELLDSARPLMARSAEFFGNDDISEKDLESYRESFASDALEFTQLQLRAYQLGDRKDKAVALKGEVETPAPKSADLHSIYWNNRALLAWIEGRKSDAVAYYQRALHSRESTPAKKYGRVSDPLMDQAKSLWTELNGTGDGFAIWAAAPKNRVSASQGYWVRPSKEMPPFELSDLTGKTWRLKSLEGKSVFINLWATWCGPCKAELPHLQKFYEQNKGRSDLVILTLNADEQSGLIEPFLNENGYTFPVLPAWTYINQVLGDWAIPQNWVVDTKGKWQWQQIGYDDQAADWGASMLAKIASVEAH